MKQQKVKVNGWKIDLENNQVLTLYISRMQSVSQHGRFIFFFLRRKKEKKGERRLWEVRMQISAIVRFWFINSHTSTQPITPSQVRQQKETNNVFQVKRRVQLEIIQCDKNFKTVN